MKVKFRILALIILSLFILASCSNSKYKDAMDHGIQSLVEKDYHQAAIHFEIALKEKPGDKDASSYFNQATEMKDAISAYEQKQYDSAINSLTTVINDKTGLKTLQSEAKNLRTQIISDKDITSSFQDNLKLVKGLITKESYSVADEKIQLLQKDIESNKILTDYQSEVTKLAEQINAVLQDSEPLKQNVSSTNEDHSTSKDTKQQTNTETLKYQSYVNGRFGFTMQYPEGLTMDPPPTNGDGARFYNSEFELTAYAGHTNIVSEGETVQTYYQQDLNSISGPIAYQKLKDNWYVISYEENGKIFYKKFFFGQDVFNTFIISYPASKQEKYGPITTHIAKTFGTSAQ